MNADVSIIGAGPTGLCLALRLARAGLRVIVVDRQPRTALENPGFDGREIAVTHETRRLLQDGTIWERISPPDISDLKHAQVFDGPDPQFSMNVRAELGNRSQLGWLVPNHLIRRAAWEAVCEQPGIQVLDSIDVSAVSTTESTATVYLKDNGRIQSKLLVAADSRFSQTRRAMGIQAYMRDYGKSMMVFRVEHEKPHDHIAWEWFGYGQTRALLPLNNNCASVVLTLPHSEMQALQKLDDEAFDHNISARYEFRLGHMRRISERHVYPLVGVYPTRFHAQRFALVGDAAVGMHPVTAHGFNLGILSVKHLAERVISAQRRNQDIASPALLNGYTRAHRLTTLPLFAATNLVVSLYTADDAPAKALRRAVLTAAGRLTPFKKLIATQLTG